MTASSVQAGWQTSVTKLRRQYDYSMLEKHEFIDFLGEEQSTAPGSSFRTTQYTVGANDP